MMRNGLAISSVAARKLIRSRTGIVLLLFIILINLVLPLNVEGNGTLRSDIQLMIMYALGCTKIMLILAAVWLGCASTAQEVEEHQIHLVVTKPVPPSVFWFGKWIGSMLVLLALLGIAFITLAGSIHIRIRLNPDAAASEHIKEDVLAARETFHPTYSNLEHRVQAAVSARHTPPSPDEILAIRNELQIKDRTVQSGTTNSWLFVLPHFANQASLYMEYETASSHVGIAPIKGTWIFRDENGAAFWTQQVNQVQPQTQTLRIPRQALPESYHIQAQFVLLEPAGATLIFSPDSDVRMIQQTGSFYLNLFRAFLILSSQLALFSALGITAGICFSLPVAVFFSTSVVFITHIAGHVYEMMAQPTNHHHASNALPDFLSHASNTFLYILHAAGSPFRTPPVLSFLSEGHKITASMLWTSLSLQACCSVLLLCVLGTWALRRRELGLPTS